MTSAKKTLAVLFVTTLGLWGCAKGPENKVTSPERAQALEFKVTKLEEDFRAAAAARDQVRVKLAAVEQERGQLQQQLQAQNKEREELRKQVAIRTTERDTLQTQFETFRQGIKSLLGQTEAALTNPSAQPVTAEAALSAPGKS